MGARQLFEARTCAFLAVGATVVTLALSLPHLGPIGRIPIGRPPLANPGIWLAAMALGLVMAGYGELLRRGSEGDWTPRPRLGPATRAWRALICLGSGLALMLPLLVASASRSIPRVTWPGLAIASLPILLLPLVMLATYAGKGPIRDRVAMVAAMWMRHPRAVLASILILPLTTLAIEGALCASTLCYRPLSFLLLDLCPSPEFLQNKAGIPIVLANDFRTAPTPLIGEVYVDELRRGYSLLGAIPASLVMPTSYGFDPHTIALSRLEYLRLRVGLTLVIVTAMLAVLAVQARWLGLLSTVDFRRSVAATTPPIGVPAIPSPRPTP